MTLSRKSASEPFYCAVAKTSSAGRCTTNCVRLAHGGQHCSDDVLAACTHCNHVFEVRSTLNGVCCPRCGYFAHPVERR